MLSGFERAIAARCRRPSLVPLLRLGLGWPSLVRVSLGSTNPNPNRTRTRTRARARPAALPAKSRRSSIASSQPTARGAAEAGRRARSADAAAAPPLPEPAGLGEAATRSMARQRPAARGGGARRRDGPLGLAGSSQRSPMGAATCSSLYAGA